MNRRLSPHLTRAIRPKRKKLSNLAAPSCSWSEDIKARNSRHVGAQTLQKTRPRDCPSRCRRTVIRRQEWQKKNLSAGRDEVLLEKGVLFFFFNHLPMSSHHGDVSCWLAGPGSVVPQAQEEHNHHGSVLWTSMTTKKQENKRASRGRSSCSNALSRSSYKKNSKEGRRNTTANRQAHTENCDASPPVPTQATCSLPFRVLPCRALNCPSSSFRRELFEMTTEQSSERVHELLRRTGNLKQQAKQGMKGQRS